MRNSLAVRVLPLLFMGLVACGGNKDEAVVSTAAVVDGGTSDSAATLTDSKGVDAVIGDAPADTGSPIACPGGVGCDCVVADRLRWFGRLCPDPRGQEMRAEVRG